MILAANQPSPFSVRRAVTTSTHFANKQLIY